uniref:Uncharacterized protein n=1 Tax=Glossina pallidipes TaxID=7398 RepID=A0A1A9ZV53_GLOPL
MLSLHNLDVLVGNLPGQRALKDSQSKYVLITHIKMDCSSCVYVCFLKAFPFSNKRLPDNDNTHKKGKNPAICKACLAIHINFSEALQPQEFEINGPDELTKNNAIIQA